MQYVAVSFSPTNYDSTNSACVSGELLGYGQTTQYWIDEFLPINEQGSGQMVLLPCVFLRVGKLIKTVPLLKREKRIPAQSFYPNNFGGTTASQRSSGYTMLEANVYVLATFGGTNETLGNTLMA